MKNHGFWHDGEARHTAPPEGVCSRLAILLAAHIAILVAAMPGSISRTLADSQTLVEAAAALPESVRRAEAVARAHVADRLREMGLDPTDVGEMYLRDGYESSHNGVVHLYFQQRWNGLDVADALLNVNVDRDGRVLSLGDRFVAGLSRVPGARQAIAPALSPTDAYAAAQVAVGPRTAGASRPTPVAAGDGVDRRRVFTGGALSQDEVPVHLVWVHHRERLVLAWRLIVRLHDNSHWLDLRLSAADGELLGYHDWVGKLTAGPATPEPSAFATDGGDPRPGTADPAPGEQEGEAHRYRVYARPLMDPSEGARTLEREPIPNAFSPDGWLRVESSRGTGRPSTLGNNVMVLADATGPARPTAEGLFDHALDLTAEPSAHTNAVLVNVFYWLNTLHDLHYRFGFDEVAGNFQHTNFGRGGKGGDPVVAIAQVGDIVAFATPPDGRSPISRLFVATPYTALLPIRHSATILDTDGAVLRELPAAGAYFGPILDQVGVRGVLAPVVDEGLTEAPAADIRRVLRRGPGSLHDGCEPFVNADELSGRVALVEEGPCSPADPARRAEAAGAVALVVAIGSDRRLHTLGGFGDGAEVGIPVLAVNGEDLGVMAGTIDLGAEIHLSSDFREAQRDAGLDASVLIHEYGHGVANRLAGGPSSVGCLQSALGAALVEGSADIWSLAFTARAEHEPTTPRAISTYVFFQEADGTGVRGVPYTTDIQLNPLTYGDLVHLQKDGLLAHSAGVRWGSILWEVYWSLVTEHGFTEDLFAGSAGNTIFLQLLSDSFKMAPCNPSFLEARDAFLVADRVSFGGVHRCALWHGFARRGLGVGATAGADAAGLEVTESFDVPVDCHDTEGRHLAEDPGGTE